MSKNMLGIKDTAAGPEKKEWGADGRQKDGCQYLRNMNSDERMIAY